MGQIDTEHRKTDFMDLQVMNCIEDVEDELSELSLDSCCDGYKHYPCQLRQERRFADAWKC